MRLTTKVALIGDRGSGKTCFLSALYAKFRTPQPFPALDDPELQQRIHREKWQHSVSFYIPEIITKHDRELITRGADGLRARPKMRFPDRTFISDFFPMKINFIGQNLQNRRRFEFQKKISIVDIPGGHLSRSFEDVEAQKITIDLLMKSEAFIVFIDLMKFEFSVPRADGSETSRYPSSRVTLNDKDPIIDEIGLIVQQAAQMAEYAEKFIPVSIIFSKCDILDKAELKMVTQQLFRKYALDLSQYSPNLITMSCPISICDSFETRFEPFNLHHPFLFSALGVVFSSYLELASQAERLRTTSKSGLFQTLSAYFGGRDGFNEITNLRDEDKCLAHMIYESMCIEELVKENFLGFAHDGMEISLPQIGVRP